MIFMNEQFPLGWGESVAVRKAFTETYNGLPITFDRAALMDMGYTPHYGTEELIKLTHEVIFRQTARRYKNVAITNGASGAITIALRAAKTFGVQNVLTLPPPYFPLYKDMFAAAGLIEPARNAPTPPTNFMMLIDSPSNPQGIVMNDISMLPMLTGHPTVYVEPRMVIWDAVYANNVYMNFQLPLPADTQVGSYSKLLGINGIRLGWIATNDDIRFERIKSLMDAEYCGLSAPSMQILTKTIKDLDWDNFEQKARMKLDANREEWSKLEKFFYNTPVQTFGMFYYSVVDNACKKLLEKAGIQWFSGSVCHHLDSHGRFNIGQDTNLIKRAVQKILMCDKI